MTSKTWKTLGTFFAIAALSLILGFWQTYHWPQFKRWARTTIASETKNGPLWILPEDLSLGFFPVGITLHNVKAVPQGKLAEFLDPFSASKVSVSIGIESFLSGNFRIGKFEIEGAELKVLQPKNNSAKTTDPADSDSSKGGTNSNVGALLSEKEFYSYLDHPLYEISLKNIGLTVRSFETRDYLQVKDLNLSVKNRGRALYAEMSTPSFSYLMFQESKFIRSTVEVNLRSLIEYGRISVPSISIKKSNGSIEVASGIDFDMSTLKPKRVSARVVSKIVLQEIAIWIKAIYPNLEFPKIRGNVDLALDLLVTDRERSAKVVLSGESLGIEKVKIGSANAVVLSDGKRIKISRLEVKNKKTNFLTSDAELDLGAKTFSSKIEVASFELQQFLQDINVGKIPVILNAKGTLPCSGSFEKEVLINCTGDVKIENVHVYNDSKEKVFTIVQLENIGLKGNVSVNNKAVEISSDLEVGSNKGFAKGVVDYKKGFRFDYNTKELDFSNIKNLAQLKFDGKAGIVGFTQGDSRSATLFMNAKTSDFWFENYGVGNANLQLSYRTGHIYLEGVSGSFQDSSYNGDIDIDLEKNRISSQFQFPSLELNDLTKAFSRRVTLPFGAFGISKGTIKVSGPLEFTKLSYNVNFRSLRSLVANETFDAINFRVESKDGLVTAKDISLKKGTGKAIMTGKGYPTGQIDLSVSGNDFQLDQSQILDKLGLQINGTTNFKMKLSGHVLSPTTNIDGQIQNLQTTGMRFPNTIYKLDIFSDHIELAGSFEDKSLKFETRIPYSEKGEFRFILDADKFNFAPLLDWSAQTRFSSEYQSSLTVKADLYSPSDYIWNSTGKVQISDFKIQKGVNELFLKNPTQIIFKNGVMNIDDLSLAGDNTQLKLEAKDSTKQKLNFAINGKIETGLIAFLTPFLSDIRGVLSIAFNLGGSYQNPEMLGSAYVNEGFAQLKAFPHPLESVKSDVIFSQSKVLINNFTARMTTGKVEADGSIDFFGLKKIQSNLNLRLDGVKIHIPEGIETQGNADLKITGDWFPYLISGDYYITSALVRKDFDGTTAGSTTTKRSIYLPQILNDSVDRATIKLDIKSYFDSGAKIQNSLIVSDFSGHLQLLGVPDDPRFLGVVELKRGGRFFFRETPFDITAAEFRFPSAEEVNPEIFLTGSTRVKDFDITLLVRGTAKNYSIRFQSAPPLSEPDIVSLLALGVTSSEMDNISSEQQMNKQGYEIGSALLSQNPIGKTIKETTGFEFKFSSAVDDTETAGSPKAVPKVIVLRQWTPNIATSMSRTLGDTSTQDVKVEYQLNNNISLVGSWEDRELNQSSSTTNEQEETTNILGIDLRYQVEFK